MASQPLPDDPFGTDGDDWSTGPALPTGAAPWPDGDWGPRLARFAASLEARFTRSGDVLSQAIDTIYTMFDGLDQLADVLNPEIAGASVAGLRAVARDLAELPVAIERRSARLAEAGDVIKALGGHVADIRRVLQILEIYGMNIKIAGAGGNFRVFVDDMAGRLKLGGAQVDSFGTRLGSIGQTLARVRKSDQRVRSARRGMSGEVPGRLQGCASALEGHLAGVADMVMTMTDLAHGVEDGIGAMLSAIQVGDSTRQRVEHIVAIVAELEGRQGAAAPAPARAHVAALVAGQLEATARAYAHESEEMRAALGMLGSCGLELGALVSRFAGHGGNTSLHDLEVEIEGIGPMTEDLRELAEGAAAMADDVTSALGELGERLEHIDQIVRDVKEIAINTRLLCKQQGHEGAAVAVIAVEVAAQARTLQSEAEAVAAAIHALGSLSETLGEEAGATRRGDLGVMLDQVLATMHEACHQSDLAIARGDASGRRLIGELDEAADAVGADAAMDGMLGDAAAAFAAIPGQPLDGAALAWLGQALPRFGALYTMTAEREVHDRFLLPGMSGLAIVPQAAAGDDVDDDGLF